MSGGPADERELRDARLFLASLKELTAKFAAEGETLAAAYADQLAALVTEWTGNPGDPELRARVERGMREFNELAGGS